MHSALGWFLIIMANVIIISLIVLWQLNVFGPIRNVQTPHISGANKGDPGIS